MDLQLTMFGAPATTAARPARRAVEDRRLGAALRDHALLVCEAGAPPEWVDLALAAVEALARVRRTITTDDVWAMLATAGAGSPPEPRAMGVVMGSAKRRGWIEPTDRVVQTARPESHCRPVRVWRCLSGGDS